MTDEARAGEPRAICGCECGCCQILHPEHEARAGEPPPSDEELRSWGYDGPDGPDGRRQWERDGAAFKVRTPAGKRTAFDLANRDLGGVPTNALLDYWHQRIAAIEREAVASVNPRLIPMLGREAAAELWQQGYAAGLERGRQPDNHPSESAPPVAPLGEDR